LALIFGSVGIVLASISAWLLTDAWNFNVFVGVFGLLGLNFRRFIRVCSGKIIGTNMLNLGKKAEYSCVSRVKIVAAAVEEDRGLQMVPVAEAIGVFFIV